MKWGIVRLCCSSLWEIGWAQLVSELRSSESVPCFIKYEVGPRSQLWDTSRLQANCVHKLVYDRSFRWENSEVLLCLFLQVHICTNLVFLSKVPCKLYQYLILLVSFMVIHATLVARLRE